MVDGRLNPGGVCSDFVAGEASRCEVTDLRHRLRHLIAKP